MRIIRFSLIIALVLAATGCARSPEGKPEERRLLVTMQVRGVINPNYYYYVVIDNDDEPTTGPEAVVAGPGFVGEHATHFVHFGPLSGATYRLARFEANHIAYEWLGSPVYSVNPLDPGNPPNTLTFAIDLTSILTPTQTSVADIQTLEVNFITNDRPPPTDPNTTEPRQYDALGDGSSNTFVSFSAAPGPPITDTSEGLGSDGLEPEDDTADPDLDIVDWSVQIQQL